MSVAIVTDASAWAVRKFGGCGHPTQREETSQVSLIQPALPDRSPCRPRHARARWRTQAWSRRESRAADRAGMCGLRCDQCTPDPPSLLGALAGAVGRTCVEAEPDWTIPRFARNSAPSVSPK